MAQHHRRRVLAANLGIAALELGAQMRDLFEKNARHVKHMRAQIADDEAFLVHQVRLAGIDVIAGAEADACPLRLADSSGGERFRRDPVGLLEAEILMYGKKQPRLNPITVEELAKII
jgi:hypothetical protein